MTMTSTNTNMFPHRLVAPHPDTHRLVYFWLTHYSLPSSISTTHGKSWLTLKCHSRVAS